MAMKLNEDLTPRMILHLNRIRDYSRQGMEIYCRKNHKVQMPMFDECTNCPYFHGMGQGTLMECEWEDQPPLYGDIRDVSWDDHNSEFMRVSQLIDKGILKK